MSSALHEKGIAHLDIRLENICWDDEGNAVFIDLDRSVSTTHKLSACVGGRYGKSWMYMDTKIFRLSAACYNDVPHLRITFNLLLIILYLIFFLKSFIQMVSNCMFVFYALSYACTVLITGIYDSDLHDQWKLLPHET